MKQKTLIIDNNQSTCNKLALIMETQMPGTELIGSFTNVSEGIQHIKNDKPKLVFVNIHDLTAENFIQLQQMSSTGFTVIFFTGDSIENQMNNIPQSILNQSSEKPVKFKFRDSQKAIEFMDNDIVRIESHSNYTSVFTTNQPKPYIISRTLKYFSTKLLTKNFIRPHRSHLVNMAFVKTYKNKQVILKDNTALPTSRRNLKAMKAVFKIDKYYNPYI